MSLEKSEKTETPETDGNGAGAAQEPARETPYEEIDSAVYLPDSDGLSLQQLKEKITQLEYENSVLRLEHDETVGSELALRKTIEKYKDLYDYAPVGYLSTDEKGIICDANMTCAQILGRNCDALTLRPLRNFVSGACLKTFDFFIYDMVKNAKNPVCELEVIRPDLKHVPVRMRGIAIRDSSSSDGEMHCHVTISDITESKNNENKLRQNEELFRNLFENTPDAIFLIDIDNGEILDANSTVASLLKRDKFQLMGIHYSTVFQRSSADTLKKIVKAASDGFALADSFAPELSALRSDGREVPLEVSVKKINVAGRNVLMSVMRDVSERVRSRQLSRIQYELITILSSTSSFSFAIERLIDTCFKIEGIDAAAVYTFDPSGAMKIYSTRGISSEFIEQIKLYHESSPEVKLARAGIPVYGTYDEIIRDVQNGRISNTDKLAGTGVIPIHSGNDVVALLSVGSRKNEQIAQSARTALEMLAASIGNVLKRIKVEDELKESEARFRTIADFTHDWEYWISPEAEFIYVSPSAKRITGYAPDEFMRDNAILRKMVAVEDWEEFSKTLTSKIEYSDEIINEIKITAKSGEKKWLSHVSCPVYGKDDAFMGRRCSARDITEKKKNEEVIRAAGKMAEEATRAKSEFLANMSHEIRTPLNAIIGFATLLLETRLSDEEKQNSLKMIKNQSEDLLVLVNDILDLSKIEAGKLELSAVPSKLKELVEKSVESVAFKAKNKGLELSWFIAPGTPEVLLIDPFRFKQILVNLIGNAVKFTAKGSVTVKIKKTEENELPYSIYSGGTGTAPWLSNNFTTLCVSVQDTGIGIPKEKQNLLFKAFSQVDGSTSRKYGGSGLGLKICSKLVEMMNGLIWVESAEGAGCTFYFTVRVPITDESMKLAMQNVALDAELNVRKTKILIADDEFVSIMLAKKLLEREGYFVTAVSNGLQLLENLEASSFDIVIMDLKMPEMDGFETTARIREIEKKNGRHIPIVGMSSYGTQLDRKRFDESGMDAFITKPIIIKELLKILNGFKKEN